MSEDESPRRRDVLRAGATAGLIGLGWTASGASAQDQTTTAQGQQGQNAFSYRLDKDDLFRTRFRPRTQEGTPATETIPTECLDGEDSQEFQILIVRAYRNGIELGYQGLFVPQQAMEAETTVAEGMTTEAALQDGTTTTTDETPTTEGETATDETSGLPEIRSDEWYRVTTMTRCGSLSQLSLETAEAPETTAES